jgi:hypothetical protein
VSLSSCDPTTVGPPRDARYVRIAGGELPPWLVGTLELP